HTGLHGCQEMMAGDCATFAFWGGVMKKVLGFLIGCSITAFAFGVDVNGHLEVPPDVHAQTGALLTIGVRTAISRESPAEMIYELNPGPNATNAIRMYSEPSHTRIAMIVDSRYAKSAAGKAWLASLEGEKQLDSFYDVGPLPQTHPTFYRPF